MSGMVWPKVIYAVGTPDYPNEGFGLYKDGLPRGLTDNADHEIRKYEPASSPQPNKEQRYREALEEIARGMSGPDGMKPLTPWSSRAALKIARAALTEETPDAGENDG